MKPIIVTLTLTPGADCTPAQYEQLQKAATLRMPDAVQALFRDTLTVSVAADVTLPETPEAAPEVFGTTFPSGRHQIHLVLEEGDIVDAWVTDEEDVEIGCTLMNVSEVYKFDHYLELEKQGRRAPIWTDHDEEPSTILYFATSPLWKDAKLIDTTAALVAAVNDPTITSLIQLSYDGALL